MNLFFHRMIILLLFVLQGLAPLVHAHVQTDCGESGLHIDGISVLTEKYSQFTSLKTIGHSDVVLGMRSAIQHKKLLINDYPVKGYRDHSARYFIQALFIEKQLFSSSPPIFQNKLSINLSIIAPRAPPLL